MSTEQRQAELAAKRAKLEEIRQKKQLGKTGASTPVISHPAPTPTGASATSLDINPDEIMREFGIVTKTPLQTSSPLSTSPSTAASTTSQQKRRQPTNLSLQIVQLSSATVSVPPKELVTYSKEVQTIESGEKDPTASPIEHSHLQWDDEFQPLPTGEHNRLVYVSSDDDTMSLDDRPKPLTTMSLSSASELKRTRSLKQQQKQLSLQGQTSLNKQELTNEEREQILKSEHFQDFFARSSRLP